MLRTLLLVFVSLAIAHVSHGQDASAVPANDITQATEQSVELNTTTELAPVETTVNEPTSNRAIDQILRNARPAVSNLATTLSSEQREGQLILSIRSNLPNHSVVKIPITLSTWLHITDYMTAFVCSDLMRRSRQWIQADLDSAGDSFHTADASEEVDQQSNYQLSESMRQSQYIASTALIIPSFSRQPYNSTCKRNCQADLC